MPLSSPLGLALVLAAAACDGGDGRCGPASGTVSRVVDGDTIELGTGEKIRYLMVDTPENTSTVECYGVEAYQFNIDMVQGQQVSLVYDEECTDRYDRLLAYVSVDGRELNTLMIERGYGCVLYIPPNGAARRDEFEALEARAKAENRGLWAACDPKPCG